MKTWLLRMGLGVPAAILLLYVFVLVRSLIPTTVNDSGLKLEPADLPQGSNAYDVLETAGSQLQWPDKQASQLADLSHDTNWDDRVAGTLIASNREALAKWDAAARLPNLQVPKISTTTDVMPYLANWKKLSALAGVRENFLLHNGQDKEAFDQIMSQIQLAREMQNAHGVLICYLVGTAINGVGLNQMQHWAGRAHLDSGQLKAYARQLDLDPEAAGAAFANTIKAEYQCQVRTLNALHLGKLADPQAGSLYPRPTHLLPAFNYSQTVAMIAQGDSLLVKAAPHHYNEAHLLDFNARRPGPVSTILSGNMAGQTMYYMMMPAMVLTLAKKSQADAQLQATRTILALRAYQLTNGHLPSDLSALVPEFLDKVPVDDFDGQPLRYSADRKIVYSVGQNLKDDGGDDHHSIASNQSPDLVYHFDF